jgi:hypothetical protein
MCHHNHECSCSCGQHDREERHYHKRQFLTKAEKIEKLKSYAEDLKKELQAVQEHIKELSS